MTRKNFEPQAHERVAKRALQKQYRNFRNITVEEEKEMMDKIKHRLSFSSLTLNKIKSDTFATTFIVHTHKPVKWIEFIMRVSDALEDVI